MSHDAWTSQPAEKLERNSLSNKELRAVLYADAPLYAQKKSERNYTGMNTFGVFIIRTMEVLQAKGENAGHKQSKGIQSTVRPNDVDSE